MFLSLGTILSVAFLLFWIWALLDCVATDSSQCRNLPKLLWIVIIVVMPGVGALVWVLLGRPERTDRHRGSTDYTAPRRPAGTDDSPQHTSQPIITDRRSRELDAELERWEREQRGESDRSDPEAPL